MNTRTKLVSLAFLGFLAVTASAQNGTQLVSVSYDDGPANSTSSHVAISNDGQFVAFVSGGDNFVPNDQNDQWDVFVRDLSLGHTSRVSVSSSGEEANSGSGLPALSRDGRYVVFESDATNLVFGDDNDLQDIFLHDRLAGTTTRISLGYGGEDSNGPSSRPMISGDGRYIVFSSDATNLVAGSDTNGEGDVFLYDSADESIVRVMTSMGEEPDEGCSQPSISLDGKFIAFASWSSNMLPGDTNDAGDVFRYEIATGSLELVSLDSEGNQGSSSSSWPSLSADGTRVAFESNSPLDENDTNLRSDIYVRDMSAGWTVWASVDSQGQGGYEQSDDPRISNDGRYVAFETWSRLAEDDLNDTKEVYRRDVDNSITMRVSLSVDLGDPDGFCDDPAMSGDGQLVAFHGGAQNLVHNDEFDGKDTFVRDVTSCGLVRFREFGEGLPGTGNHMPLLAGIDGDCSGTYAMMVANGLGAAPGVVWVGIGETELPSFGGNLYVDLMQPFFVLPVMLGGTPGAPGEGSLVLTGEDISAISGEHFFMQFMFLDAQAVQGVSISNGLEFWLR